MIDLLDSLRLVLKNMIEKKGRVLLTISGIIIGIFTFTFFIFVSQGLENAITEQFSSFGINALGIQKAGGIQGPPTGDGMTDKEIQKIKQVAREYNYIAPGIFYSAQFEYGREKASTITLGYPDEFLTDIHKDMGIKLENGRDLRAGDRAVVVIGHKFATEGFGKDNEIQIGNSIKIQDKSFRVIGIIEEQGDLFIDNSVSMPFEDIKEISGQETYSVIRVSFKEGADLNYYKEIIDKKLNPGTERNFDITSPQDAIDTFNQILGLLTAIISFVSAIALIVGGINVMNTMYSNVLERINEISVMKALGGSNHDIRNLFLIESGTLGLIGALLGFFAAYGLSEILSYLIGLTGYDVPIHLEPAFLIGVITITTIFAMLFGTYPAIRAANIEPAENLREE